MMNYKFNMKLDYNLKLKNRSKVKVIFVMVLLLCSMLMLLNIPELVSADNSNDVTQELSINIDNIINAIDFKDIENIANELDALDLFKTSVKDKVKDILNGNYFIDYTSLSGAILSLIFGDIKSFVPILFTIVAIGILCSLLDNFKSSNSVSDTIYFVGFAVVVIIILIAFKDILFGLNTIINSITGQMQIIFPILMAMLTSIGSVASISIYNPLLSIFTSIVSIVFEKVLYPIFVIIFLMTVIGNLTITVKLDKFSNFLNSTFKWIIGFVFTIFTGFLSIQGISAGKFDSISIKTTKFAMKSYIPIIGSYISEGMDFLILGSVLVKNTIGLVGVLLVFVTIISPIINIVVFKLGLQLTSAILELSGADRLSGFLSSCAKVLVLPIVILLGIAFMYVITISLIMCTANIF